jgi:hypothetical protein
MTPSSNHPPVPWRVLHLEPPEVDVPTSLTAGLWRLRGHPDLVVLDMPGPSARHYLDRLGRRVRTGIDLRAGDVLGGLHPTYRFALVAVEDDDFRARLGRWDLTRRHDAQRHLLQLVWPDLCGTLPWEIGYDAAAAGLRQPVLSRWPRGRARRSA